MKIVFLAAKENSHGRVILSELINNNFKPAVIFLGNSKSRVNYRLLSIKNLHALFVNLIPFSK